ncbi:MAG TPA: AzlC family ABC transporter permease [Bacillota bacterium]|nr:AzlC family ABC transporter permease [Bacillota bacterium]
MSGSSFLQGAKKSVPIMLGYTPLGLAFGVVARTQGLSIWQTALMSLTSYTGSGQFIAVGMLGAGAGISAILLANMLVNLRYLLFSAAMTPYVSRIPAWLQALMSFGITDETFVVNMAQFDKQEADPGFILGVNTFAHLSWVLNSALGAAIGEMLPDINKFGVNYALTAMFIALLLLQIKDRVTMWVALLSGVFSLLIAHFFPGSSNIIMATVVAATIGVMVCRRKPKST